jgi:hypothetical protein
MKIYGWRTGGWPPHPGANKPSGVVLNYAPEGLQQGEIDKFYAAGVWITAQNYLSEGTLVGANADPAATSFTASGMKPGRQHYIIGVRHNSSGVPTGVFSNVEIINVAQKYVDTLPPNVNIVSNWETDNFLDYFFLNENAVYLAHYRADDPVMGKIIRIRNKLEAMGNVAFPAWCGIPRVSPRYNFSVEMTWRIHDPWKALQQVGAGIISGGQHVIWHEGHAAHGTVPNGSPDQGVQWPGGSDTAIEDGEFNGGCLFATLKDPNYREGSTDTHGTNWRIQAAPNHPNYNKWVFNTGDENNAAPFFKTKLSYDAALDRAYLFNDETLLTTFWSGADYPLHTRSKGPDGPYPFGVSQVLRGQDFPAWAESMADFEEPHWDIGEIKITSDCPYEYSSFSTMYETHLSAYGIMNDGGQMFYEEGTHTCNNLRYYFTYFAKRFSSNRWSGLTIPPIGSTSWQDFVWPNQTYTYPVGQTFSAKTPPVKVSQGKNPLFYDFKGVKLCNGILRGRLLNQDDVPITEWVNITTVVSAPLLEIPPNYSTEVKAEVEMRYDGGAFGDADRKCPMLFVGFDLYSREGSFHSRSGDTITITAWDGATIYHKFDDNEYEPYTGTDPLALTIPEGAMALHYYAGDASYTEAERVAALIAAKNPIFRGDGSRAGNILKGDGSKGGIVMKNNGGTWSPN